MSSVKLPPLTTKRPPCNSVAQLVVVRGQLLAVAHPTKRTGYKDPLDFSNRSDQTHGGEFRTFSSAYQETFNPLGDKPVQFRHDGRAVQVDTLTPGFRR